MLGSGLLIAPLRRRGGLGAVWALLGAAWILLSWLSARAWDAALHAGFRIVDYGPRDERWAITAGLLAAGTVATQFTLHEAARDASAPRGLIASLERGIIEAFLEGAASFVAFMLGGIGAGADISRPVVATLALYAVFLIWTVQKRRRGAAA